MVRRGFHSLHKWIINDNQYNHDDSSQNDKIDWYRATIFIAMHFSCALVFWVGFSWVAFSICVGLYFVRLFGIGAFYHRYFSHKAFQTNRFWQCVFAIIGVSSAQRGPLWWASHHRQHHLCSDQPTDAHSPVQHGFWWSHAGWFLTYRNYHYNPERVKDFAKFPELAWIDRYDTVVPTLLFLSLIVIGKLLQIYRPDLGTSASQLTVWGFCISTIVLFHTTVSINSLSHVFGTQRFVTDDNSRNNWLLAILTLGEGWHNNHHHYPTSARQGFMWYEIDITYTILKLLEKMHIIHNVKTVPPSALLNNRL